MILLEPVTIEAACAALAAEPDGARPISGGTALVLMMRQGLVAPDTLVSLAKLPSLRGIELQAPDRLRIGAGVTLSEVADSDVVRELAPSLAYACRRVGNIRVRNVATLGGNVAEADYASDPPSVLISLDAVCRVSGPGGDRTVPVGDLIVDFFTTTLETGEVITEICVPIDRARRATYLKYISRSSEDRPCVGVAASADLVDGQVTRLSVVVGAVASVPQRFTELTDRGIGTHLEPAIRNEIAAGYAGAIDAMDDARGTAWYRRQMTEVFVRRALDELVGPGAEGDE